MKKKFINILGILVGLILTYFFVFKTLDYNELLTALKNVSYRYLFLGLICMCIYIICEAYNVRRTMKVCEKNSILLSESISYTSTGFFFSAITPSSIGGQPMQLVLMNRKKHHVEHSSLALLIEVIGAQSAAYVLALIGFIYYKVTKIYIPQSFMSLFFLGLFFSGIFISFLLLAVFHSGFMLTILNKFLKKKPIQREQAVKKITEYAKNASYMKTHAPSILKIILRSFLKMCSYNAIPYFVCLSLGIEPGSIIKIILLQSMLYLAVGFIPIPGAMGVNEGLFGILYATIVTKFLGPLTILTRLLNFYIPVLVTGIISYISFSKSYQ